MNDQAASKHCSTAAAIKAARAIQAQIGTPGAVLPLAAIIDSETGLPALIEANTELRITLDNLARELVAFANANNRINLSGHLALAVELARKVVAS